MVDSSKSSALELKTPPFLRANEVINIENLLSMVEDIDNPKDVGYTLLNQLLSPSLKNPSAVINILRRCPDEGTRHTQIRNLVHSSLTHFPDTSNRMKILSIAERLIDKSPALSISIKTATEELKNLIPDKS